MTTQNDKLLLGEAAEALVISRLLRRGYLAGPFPRGWKSDDVMVSSPDDPTLKVTVQVKATNKTPKVGWMVGGVNPAPGRFVALVDYQERLSPVVYLVPSAVLREAVDRADDVYHQLHPGTAEGTMRKAQDPWPKNYAVPDYPDGWLIKTYCEAWDQIASAGGVHPA